MRANYNVTGDERKALVGIISEVIGMKPVYMRMPTCNYVISNITVEKDGTMVWDERTDQDTIEAVIIALAAAGFKPVKNEDDAKPETASDEYGLVRIRSLSAMKRIRRHRTFWPDARLIQPSIR